MVNINHKTTCCNWDCPEYTTCTHNIHSDGLKCKTNMYTSQKEASYKQYVKKGGTLSYNEYHNC
jgi:hypothetical protein